MKKIIVLGAGLSATILIEYLLEQSEAEDWMITVCDFNLDLAQKKVNGHKRGNALYFNAENEEMYAEIIKGADVVVSLLPARYHDKVADTCLSLGINMATASYVSTKIKSMEKVACDKGLTFLNELGVDPGIDHMSAMRIIENIREKGGELTSFYSYTGGLIAADSDNNPWNYKFTWNPRNVVLAGQGVSQLKRNHKYKYIPYHKLFDRVFRMNILEFGEFEVYPNRDSLKYRKIYGLEKIPTMFRGTVRRPGFCEAWNVFVQLGCTDDTYTLEDSANMTYREFINTFLRYQVITPVEQKLCDYLDLDPEGEVMKKLEWLGIFENKPIGLDNATPAQILQKILEEKWNLSPDDNDMIVMQHEFEYKLDNILYQATSSMGYIGEGAERTAMAVTVGTPLAIAVKLLLTGKITSKGILVPTIKELYEPILDELEAYGIHFVDKDEILDN
ncbi:saccharopine dehydrogenase C-terminal domain-containing protein [Bacteroidota bacterium]